MSEIEIRKTEDEIDLLKIVSILLKNIKWIIGLPTISMIITVTYAIISLILPQDKSYMPNVYSPKSTVLINSSSDGAINSLLSNSGMGSLAGLAGLSGSSSGPSNSSLAIKLATTNSFINKLNDTFKLSTIYDTKESKHPLTNLKNIINSKLTLKMDGKSGLLEISYTDVDKNLATDIVNKATSLLEEEFAKIDIIRNNNQFALVEENKIKVEQEIENIKKNIVLFQKKHHLVDVNIVFGELMKLMSTMQTALLNKEIEIENYSLVSNIKDPGFKRLANERKSIINAIHKLEEGEAGNYPPVKDLPELALELDQLRAEMDIQQAVYKTIIQQYETLKLTSTGTGPTFQVLERAEIPEIKSGPSRAKLCISVAFASFFLSIFFVFMKEVYFNIKNDPEKMRRLRGEK